MKEYDRHPGLAVIVLGAALLAGACGKEKAPGSTVDTGNPANTAGAETGPAGKVILVEATSDAQGNYFAPKKIEAHKGDILRFSIKAGVHNVNFLADSNPGKSGLPAPSEMLQIPGQTYDVKVTFAKGHYYFQCDPHALLGMKGYLEVEE